MKIPSSVLPYLLNQTYSNGLTCQFEIEPDDRHYMSRLDYLVQLANNKKVIHIGCVDHNIESIQNKINKGKWLHKLLCDSSSRCAGIDIQNEGIKFLKEQLGYDDSYVADVTQELPDAIKDSYWDYVLLPEVLEHINNPVAFLHNATAQLKPYARELVITVPNAFHKANFKYSVQGKEIINTDHRFWFTPYTLAKIVTEAGLEITSFAMTSMGRIKKRSLLKNQWYARHPLSRSNIVMHIKLN